MSKNKNIKKMQQYFSSFVQYFNNLIVCYCRNIELNYPDNYSQYINLSFIRSNLHTFANILFIESSTDI